MDDDNQVSELEKWLSACMDNDQITVLKCPDGIRLRSPDSRYFLFSSEKDQ